MSTEIGSFDAKTQLSRLLRDVQAGRRYTITVRGRPVADLIPHGAVVQQDNRAAVEAMHVIRKVRGVSGEELADWINEGRQ